MRSAAHAFAFALLIPRANRYILVRALAGSLLGATRRLVHRELLIADSYATSIVAQVVDAAINIVVDHLTRLQESLLNIKARFGRRLQEDEAVLLGEALAFLGAHLASAIEVRLVAYEHEHDVGVAILPDLLEPTCQMIERLLPCYIVH